MPLWEVGRGESNSAWGIFKDFSKESGFKSSLEESVGFEELWQRAFQKGKTEKAGRQIVGSVWIASVDL